MMATSVAYAQQVLSLHRAELQALPNVISVQTTVLNGDAVILVFLAQAGGSLPNYLDGVRVVPRVVGNIQPMIANTARYRPVLGGISIGHPNIGAGTLGAILYLNGEPYLASDNHVFDLYGKAKKGDPILQPGILDGGEDPDDIVGNLYWWQEVGRDNLIDFALAKPLDPSLVEKKILGLDGYEVFPADAEIGDTVDKSGRSTGVTRGQVTSTDASLKIGGTNYNFHDVLLIEGDDPLCIPGDSGSAVMRGNDLVGFLFAGPADPPYNYYFAYKAMNVERALMGQTPSRGWILPAVGAGLAFVTFMTLPFIS
jgi:hypothetical protein